MIFPNYENFEKNNKYCHKQQLRNEVHLREENKNKTSGFEYRNIEFITKIQNTVHLKN